MAWSPRGETEKQRDPVARRLRALIRWSGLLAALATAPALAAAPIPVRVVVVATFELGADGGDKPGEFQDWVERLPLPDTIPAPGTYHGHMRYNPALQVLGVVTGEGPEHAAAAMTALLTDPRFDLRHAYVLLAGIAGIDPNFGSIGSAVWAPDVINGGLSHQLDARELPPGWPDGFTPIEGRVPDTAPVPPLHSNWGDQAFSVDPGLLAWAVRLTRDVPLPDSAALRGVRAAYVGFPNAQRPPAVMRGDVIASASFWTGPGMNAWAERWVRYWTGGRGVMATTAEEDLGFMQALSLQAAAGRIDMRRVLVLRTASNFDMPPRGRPADAMLASEDTETGYPAFLAALDAAYRVGSVVVLELARHWDRYEAHPPGR